VIRYAYRSPLDVPEQCRSRVPYLCTIFHSPQTGHKRQQINSAIHLLRSELNRVMVAIHPVSVHIMPFTVLIHQRSIGRITCIYSRNLRAQSGFPLLLCPIRDQCSTHARLAMGYNGSGIRVTNSCSPPSSTVRYLSGFSISALLLISRMRRPTRVAWMK
jgi:hypothetical protein